MGSELLHALLDKQPASCGLPRGLGPGQEEGWYPEMLSVRGGSHFIHILSDSWGRREVKGDSAPETHYPGDSRPSWDVIWLT